MWKNFILCKKKYLSLFIQLYIARVGSGENFPDPAKKGPDPEPWKNLNLPEGSPAVEGHDGGEVLQLLALLGADVGDVLGAGDAELVGVLVVHHQVGQQGDHVHGEGQALHLPQKGS